METGIRTLTEQDLGVLSATKQVEYGAVGVTEDGRRFRYASFGGTATIPAGLLVVAPTITNSTAGFQGMTITAVATGGQVTANLATGSTQIVLSNTGGTAITVDQFAEGELHIIVGGAAADAASYTYRVRGNTAAAATTGYVTVFLNPTDAFRNATALVAGTDTACLDLSPYSGVNTSTTAALVVGATINPVVNTATVTNYGWVETAGPLTLLNDSGGTITVGGAFGQSTTTAGNIKAATASTVPIVGTTRVAITASNAGPVFLNIS
jgi:hypothetical protein